MITDKEIEFPNVTVNDIGVLKLSGTQYYLWQSNVDNPDSYISFNEIVIEEDMFAGPVVGYIVIQDSSYLIEQLNLSIYDSLFFTIDNKTYWFRISNIETQTDFASKNIHGPAGIVSTVTIRFTSDEFLYRNFDIQPLANFIGKISKKQNTSAGNANQSQAESKKAGVTEVPSSEISLVEGLNLPADLVEEVDENEMKGFVNTIIKSMSGAGRVYKKGEPFVQLGGWSGKQLKADETFNDIWIKPNPSFYPFSKTANSSKMHQLMNYVCEYACLKYKEDRVDFFFWEDLDYWNFRSAYSLSIQEDNFMGTYTPTENSLLENSIVSMEIINELNIPHLMDSGSLFSEYIRVVPNWADVYRSNLDSGNSLIKRQISYVYDYPILSKPIIAKYPPVNTKTLIALKNDNNPPIPFNTNRIMDNNYGYHSLPYNTKTSPWWNFYNHMSEGFTGDRMRDLEIITTEDELLEKHLDFTELFRLETEYWQAQFDFCELPGAILRKIYKEIKWPLAKARRNYAKLKAIRSKWNTYKKNICCEREVPLNFFAILTDADKIYGATASSSFFRDSSGIYAYSWAEVEIWPKSYLNSTDIWHKTKKIIEFEDKNFPFIFAMPNGGLVGGSTKEYTVQKQDYLITGIPEVKDTHGITGVIPGKYFTPDTRAYNMNELLNSVAPINFEDGTAYQTLLMNPGITDVLGTLTTNREKYTNYPTQTIMMPVGKFRIISSTCPDFSSSGTQLPATSLGQNAGGFYYGGRIVQMNAIPKEILQSFYETSTLGLTAEDVYTKPDKGITGLPYMFLFDAENAHDGLCNSDNCA